MAGDERFHALLEQIGALHDAKQRDYGADGDPFANVRASEKWGIKPWVGALVRLNDKVHRLQQFALKGKLANEGAEDSMMDIAVYALIALILYREEPVEHEPDSDRHSLVSEELRKQAIATEKAYQRTTVDLEPVAWKPSSLDALERLRATGVISEQDYHTWLLEMSGPVPHG